MVGYLSGKLVDQLSFLALTYPHMNSLLLFRHWATGSTAAMQSPLAGLFTLTTHCASVVTIFVAHRDRLSVNKFEGGLPALHADSGPLESGCAETTAYAEEDC